MIGIAVAQGSHSSDGRSDHYYKAWDDGILSKGPTFTKTFRMQDTNDIPDTTPERL